MPSSAFSPRTQKYEKKCVKKKSSQKSFDFKLLFSADGGGRTHMVSRTILSRLRLPFRHIGLYSILGHSYRFLKIGGMFRRDVRNPASTNFQNLTSTREFLAQTRKITKRILSPPRLPFRHTGVFCFTDNIVIIADFSLKIKMQLTTHQISANFLSLFGPRACILRETTSYPKEYSL